MKNRNLDHKDDWKTPPEFYEKLNKKYHFDFDPCPWHNDIDRFNGLVDGWGYMNFVNPPYSNLKETGYLKASFVKRAIYFKCMHDRRSVMLLPVSTSTILFHDYIKPHISRPIEHIRGRLSFIGTNDKGQLVNYHQIQEVTKETIEYDDPKKGLIEIPKYVKQSGQHDSMLAIF
jgi:hypothetical protein